MAGGLAFATAWLALLCIAYLYHQPNENGAGGLVVAACASLVVAGGANVYRRHAADMVRYAAQYEAPTILAGDWWAQDWQQLPAQRIDLAGETEEPLTFQWAGSLERLKSDLAQKGLHPPTPWTLAGALAWFTPHPDPMDLPTSPSKPENECMFRFLITIGAVYAAFKLGKDVGRGQARILLSGPVDYERWPSARSRDEAGLYQGE